MKRRLATLLSPAERPSGHAERGQEDQNQEQNRGIGRIKADGQPECFCKPCKHARQHGGAGRKPADKDEIRGKRRLVRVTEARDIGYRCPGRTMATSLPIALFDIRLSL